MSDIIEIRLEHSPLERSNILKMCILNQEHGKFEWNGPCHYCRNCISVQPDTVYKKNAQVSLGFGGTETMQYRCTLLEL